MEMNGAVPSITTKGIPMRDILHKTKEVLQGRGKTVIIREHAEDKECVSDVRKTFIYIAQEVDIQEDTPTPQVHIAKSYDSLTRDEKFCFHVKGIFYVNRNRRLVKVGYCHTLRIRLHWKSKVSSPKKSVTMA
jgi:hypothetical protein